MQTDKELATHIRSEVDDMVHDGLMEEHMRPDGQDGLFLTSLGQAFMAIALDLTRLSIHDASRGAGEEGVQTGPEQEESGIDSSTRGA